jgi:hypothetical protein
LRGAFLIQPALGLAQPRPAAGLGRQLLGQLIAALLAVELILGFISAAGLFEDLLGNLLVGAVGIHAGVRPHLRAVDRHHPGLQEPRVGAQLKHVADSCDSAASWRARKRAIVV